MNADLIERLNALVDCGCLEDAAAISEAADALAAKETALSEIAQQLEQTRIELGETQLVLATTEHNCTAALSEMRAELERVKNERDVLAYKLDQAVNTTQPMIIARALASQDDGEER